MRLTAPTLTPRAPPPVHPLVHRAAFSRLFSTLPAARRPLGNSLPNPGERILRAPSTRGTQNPTAPSSASTVSQHACSPKRIAHKTQRRLAASRFDCGVLAKPDPDGCAKVSLGKICKTCCAGDGDEPTATGCNVSLGNSLQNLVRGCRVWAWLGCQAGLQRTNPHDGRRSQRHAPPRTPRCASGFATLASIQCAPVTPARSGATATLPTHPCAPAPSCTPPPSARPNACRPSLPARRFCQALFHHAPQNFDPRLWLASHPTDR